MRVKRILSEEAEMVEMPTQMYSLYYQNIGLRDKPQPKSKVFHKLSVLCIVDIISLRQWLYVGRFYEAIAMCSI